MEYFTHMGPDLKMGRQDRGSRLPDFRELRKHQSWYFFDFFFMKCNVQNFLHNNRIQHCFIFKYATDNDIFLVVNNKYASILYSTNICWRHNDAGNYLVIAVWEI